MTECNYKEKEELNDKPGENNKIDAGLQCFATIARFHGISIDPEQIKHSLGLDHENMKELHILSAAKEVKLKAKAADVEFDRLKKMKLPVIVETKDEGFFILAKMEEDKLLVLYPQDPGPKIVTSEQFKEVWKGRIILFTTRKITMQSEGFSLKWFIPSIIKYKKPLIEVLIAALTLQVFGLFTPIMMQVVIDKVLVHNSLTTLDVLATALIIITIFELVMTVARTYIFTHTTSKIDVMLGARLCKHLFSLPLRYFETRRVGDTIARVREVENIRQFLTGAPLTTIIDLMFIIVYIAVMLFYSTTLTWIVLGSLPIFILISAFITPLFKARLEEKFNCGAESQSYMVEAVSGVQTIKSFALEPAVQKKWEGLLANYTKANFKTAILGGNASALAQFTQKIFNLIILWIGAQLVMRGDITVGKLITFRMLASSVSSPVLRIVQMWQELQQVGISIKRLGDIFNTKGEPSLDSSKTKLPAIRGHIRFEKVRFRYRADSSEVIRNMSFEIPQGTIVGVVGRSGSGKSTISKLIQRLYAIEAGKILIDGIDLALADPLWLRRQIGVVLQENFMFNGSVKENICIHKPGANMEEIIRVAQIAGAHEFILELAEGYDTIIGEKGTGLSGGQKQRIAIARALLNNPKILIFDEATSALDYESESIIQRNLKMICKDRTVIIIAHRLSTLKDVDRIMAIDRGEIVEYGPQEELLKKKGLYYYLHSQQQRGESC